MRKNLTTDTDGLLPIIIVAGVATLLGYSWLTQGVEDTTEMLKVYAVSALIFTVGLFALMGKFAIIPWPLSISIGLGCIGGSVYLVYLGEFPTFGV